MNSKVANPGHLRATLGVLWSLNFSIVATSLLWSVSCISLIQVNSLLLRLLAVSTANAAIIVSASLIIRSVYGKDSLSWKAISRDRVLISAPFLTGICLVLSLENIQRFHGGSSLTRSYVVGVFVSMLIGWFFVALVVVPIRLWSQIEGSHVNLLESVLSYLKANKTSVFSGLALLILGWPIFFIYLFLALGLAQAFQITNFPQPEESSERYFRRQRDGLN